MRSCRLLTSSLHLGVAILLSFILTAPALAQRIALLVPEADGSASAFINELETSLAARVRVLDTDAASAAFRTLNIASPFNMSAAEAKRVGDVTGCDHAAVLRFFSTWRTSFSTARYYETAVAIFVVEIRSGRLVRFILESKKASTKDASEKQLLGAADALAVAIVDAMRSVKEVSTSPAFTEYDADEKSMRPAMPYRRIKPVYTETAFLYEIAATVDAEVSIDADGSVKRIDITRWAGFGLEESVIAAIREMNWRPGERNGKPLPMRVLLRYNFTKVEKVEQ